MGGQVALTECLSPSHPVHRCSSRGHAESRLSEGFHFACSEEGIMLHGPGTPDSGMYPPSHPTKVRRHPTATQAQSGLRLVEALLLGHMA